MPVTLGTLLVQGEIWVCVYIWHTEWPTPKVPHDTACGFHTV